MSANGARLAHTDRTRPRCPLGRIALLGIPLLLSASAARAQAPEAEPAGSASSHTPAESSRPSSAAKAPPVRHDPRTIERALARFAHEPSVGEVVAAALRATRARDPEDVASRARAAGWVPRLSLRARRGTAVDLSDGGDSVRLSTDDDLTLEAGLVFELDRLVFRREETAIFRDARGAESARRALAREVVSVYFERRRLQLQRALSGDPDGTRALRIAELGAVLDIFTNGAFLAMMRDARWKTADSTPVTGPRSRPRSSSTATR